MYSYAYIVVKGTIIIAGAEADSAARQAEEINKWITFQFCAALTDCVSEVKNIQADNAKDQDVVMTIVI